MPPSAPPLRLADGLSRDYLLHRGLAPKCIADDGALVVLAAPDAIVHDIDDIAHVYRAVVRIEPATLSEVEQLIERLCMAGSDDLTLAPADDTSDDVMADVRDLANEAPVVRYVNLLVREAYDAGASDIHLEATRTGLTARFRIDGVLVPAPEPPRGMHFAIVSRLKLVAKLDISERRRPQDGRIPIRMESRDLDLRFSAIPTMHGESLVLRLLDRGGRPVGLDELGMDAEDLPAMQRLAARPHGMVLVTGPTGSGKTTTLYAALAERDAASEKIITVEDPIEYQIAGITQMPVNRDAGTTFGTALRSILRQDPDVLMVGEMRDAETAELAVQAAMTGHLVFTTLHTNDAIGAIPRLIDLGVPSYLVAATIEGIVAQRLVRRICEQCREEFEPRSQSVAALAGRPVGRMRLMRGVGCPACRGTGFRGRVGIFELLVVDDRLRDAIVRGESRGALKVAAEASGARTLRHDGWRKVERGLTTVEEVLRVVDA